MRTLLAIVTILVLGLFVAPVIEHETAATNMFHAIGNAECGAGGD